MYSTNLFSADKVDTVFVHAFGNFVLLCSLHIVEDDAFAFLLLVQRLYVTEMRLYDHLLAESALTLATFVFLPFMYRHTARAFLHLCARALAVLKT